jgi:hypothetical protein
VDLSHLQDGSQVAHSLELPEEPFQVWRINLEGHDDFSDEDLRQLVMLSRGLSSLRNLNLKKTGITSAGLAHLVSLAGQIRELTIENTRAVEDTSVRHLVELKLLRLLFLSPWKGEGPEGVQVREISEEGRRALAEALPNCSVKWRPESP